jgi:uncharacterized protein (DUF2252 family)
MKTNAVKPVRVKDRQVILSKLQRLKMARSAHAYVRGNTPQFYEWLEAANRRSLPQGPGVWICGDCHLGNLGPVADADGQIDVQIRDLDQTVVGNPAHDLIRLGLSLATAARGSDLPGVTTATMIEQMIEGYARAFMTNGGDSEHTSQRPEAVRVVMKRALQRSWKHLADERIGDATPRIPLGKRFWPLSRKEKLEIKRLFNSQEARDLVTSLRSRDDDARIRFLDAAYWVKGCSSLGRLRYAVLLGIANRSGKHSGLCLMDIKEAVKAASPRYVRARMPRDNAERIVEGARHVAPYLGERMLAARFLDHAIFVRELLPQDLKIEIERLTRAEAINVARYLAMVVGEAHARQMDASTRREWLGELRRNRSKTLDAPSWLWSSIVELIVGHEASYLEHCRNYAMEGGADA